MFQYEYSTNSSLISIFSDPTKPQNSQWILVLLTRRAYKPVEDKVHFFSSVFTRAENLQEKSSIHQRTINMSSSCLLLLQEIFLVPILFSKNKLTGPREIFSILSSTEANPLDIPLATCFQIPFLQKASITRLRKPSSVIVSSRSI